MPNFKGIFLPVDNAPVVVTIHATKNNVHGAINQLLNCESGQSAQLANCELGVMYSLNSGSANLLATRVRCQNSRNMDDKVGKTSGVCFLLAEDEKGFTTSVNEKVIQSVAKMYEELTGYRVPGMKKPKSKTGVKRATRDVDFFNQHFQASRRAELKNQNITPDFTVLNNEVREAWKVMTDEEKMPYVKQAQEDRKRYHAEMEKYLKENPPRPKNPRNPYNMFCQAFQNKDTRPVWKDVSVEEKSKFEKLAEEDKIRFERELAAFKIHCQETGQDFDALTARKKRKAETRSEDEMKKSRKNHGKKSRKTDQSGDKAEENGGEHMEDTNDIEKVGESQHEDASDENSGEE